MFLPYISSKRSLDRFQGLGSETRIGKSCRQFLWGELHIVGMKISRYACAVLIDQKT